ncbi:MAG: hypothetical protein CNE99_09540 [OM182 bacterium MED-G24]|uniref:FimV N-terminal domain-containing protein n=1 Tax=OM182 bacterium MED-G24 TaxID=1986255 RepID=A0A2A5WJT7_9GAMM|nr:MAG: hypothetical protein CNE99_09540 [OM182 bacterium MED-G24]
MKPEQRVQGSSRKMMIRRLVLLCVLLTTMSTAYGLGLGRLEMRSALNQNFEGEIELTNVGNLSTDEVVSNLATQDDFERVGIERTALLLDLDFETVQREDGSMVIVVTSPRPIFKPFQNFLVEVLWPNGRVLREYTVLLDPPVFSQGGIFANGEYGMTGPGDTLWNVASKVRPNRSVSFQQTMLALVEANPEAFVNGNVNLLKAGYVLRVPDLGEIRALSATDAVSEIDYHNDEFESYRSGKQVAQLDATRRTRPSGVSSDGRIEALENELSVIREDLDRARRANDELNTHLNDLQEQMETMNAVLSKKNDQFALLQNEVQKMQSAAAAAPSSAPAQPQDAGLLLTNTYVLGGLVLLGVALVAGLLVFMRRRQQDDGDLAQPFVAREQDSMPSPDQELSLADMVERSATAAGVDSVEEDESVEQETEDPITEADILDLEDAGELDLDPDLGDVAATGDGDEDDLSLDDSLDLDLDAEETEAREQSTIVLGDGDLDLDADDDELDPSTDDDELVLDMDAEDDDPDLDADEDAGTKLDLARAYIYMGDTDGARGLLREVIADGSDDDVAAANELLSGLSD